MKEQIKQILLEKKQLTLQEFYKIFETVNKSKLRSTLNFLVNNNEIIRASRGVYKSI